MARRALILLLMPLLAFTWNLGQRTQQQPVEQQTPGGATQPDRSLWVVNPGPCAWDTDDQLEVRGFGNIAPGETVEWYECVLADGEPHLFDAQVAAKGRPGAALVVEVGWSNADASRSFTVPGTPGAQNSTSFLGCFVGPEYDRSAPLPPVDGSNGGVAQLTDVFVRVTNPGPRATRDAAIFTTIEPDFHPCPDGRIFPFDFTRETVTPALWWYR